MTEPATQQSPKKSPRLMRRLWKKDWIRFIVAFLVIKLIVQFFEEFPVVQRAMLPGVDIAMMPGMWNDSARHTVVVGITADDVADYFRGQRPIQPASLLAAVDTLMRLEPVALVVDVFTESSGYAAAELDALYERIRIKSARVPVVWAQSADTSVGGLLPVLGDRHQSPGVTGIAAMLAEEDGLVRRVRLRFRRTRAKPSDSSETTLPYAAVLACTNPLGTSTPNGERACSLAGHFPSDTASVALRPYAREPTVYPLRDVLFAARSGAPNDAFKGRLMVLGFVDGSDQVATPYGIRPGPRVVADAIETLVDDRGLIRRPPWQLSWSLDFAGAFGVFMLQRLFPSNAYVAAFLTLLLTVLTYGGTRWLTLKFGYWTSALPVMIGVWFEELGEQIRETWKKQQERLRTGSHPIPPNAVQGGANPAETADPHRDATTANQPTEPSLDRTR